MNNRIFIIGYPGAGKSTYGKNLSKDLNMLFVDLDNEIEHLFDCKIDRLIHRYGLEKFRKIESSILHRVIREYPNNIVVSCGGGTPCYHNNLEYMKSYGLVIWVKTSWIKIFWRLLKDRTRPLTKNKLKLPFTLFKMYVNRNSIYKKANQTISV